MTISAPGAVPTYCQLFFEHSFFDHRLASICIRRVCHSLKRSTAGCGCQLLTLCVGARRLAFPLYLVAVFERAQRLVWADDDLFALFRPALDFDLLIAFDSGYTSLNCARPFSNTNTPSTSFFFCALPPLAGLFRLLIFILGQLARNYRLQRHRQHIVNRRCGNDGGGRHARSQFVAISGVGLSLIFTRKSFASCEFADRSNGLTGTSDGRRAFLDDIAVNLYVAERVNFYFGLLSHLHICDVGLVNFDLGVDLRHVGDGQQRR